MYFGRITGGYRVFRITPESGQHFTGFNVGEAYEYVQSTGEYGNYTSHNVLGQYSGVVEVYGNLPYIQYGCGARTCKNLQSFDVTNVSPNSMNYAFAYDASLVNVNLFS